MVQNRVPWLSVSKSDVTSERLMFKSSQTH